MQLFSKAALFHRLQSSNQDAQKSNQPLVKVKALAIKTDYKDSFMRHLISILLENETGALSRVVGMFSQRGYNIETITAAPTENPHMSRITISTIGDDVDLEQIKKQIHKLINVHTVSTLEDGKSENTIELELIFLKVKANNNAARENVKRIADIFDAKIVDLTPEVYTVCLSAGRNKINRLMKAMQESAEILETVRSGVVAISRGSKALGHK